MLKFLGSLLDSNERELNKIEPLVVKINSLEEEVKKLSPAKFKEKAGDFRKRIEKGEDLDSLLPEVFALVREAARRTLGQRHFDVQLGGGIILHHGRIAEMRTGEGKTLVATLPLSLNALTGKGAHLVTVNDYLAKRDAEWMGPIYDYLGLSVGVINHDVSYLFDPNKEEAEKDELKEQSTTPEAEGLGVGKFLREVTRREAYAADITYGTNNEYGFDYLRDNMAGSLDEMTQRPLSYAIVDEVDSILIDEARTPLIISAPAEESTEKYLQFASLVGRLVNDTDYAIDEKMRTANLTEIGVSKIERMLGVKNLYESDFEAIHHVEEALKAQTLYHKDKDYVVKDGEILIVDEFTGRLLPGRRYSEGLHQAIEAKEGVAVQKESKTMATISFQNLFRLYEKLAGMTGTAQTSAEEFHKVYELDVVNTPTHKPMIREDFPDSVYKTEKAKWQAVAGEIEENHTRGQPVLVGTTSIEKNELLSDLLKRKKIPHELLNAKNHEREAQIIANAGQNGSVTVATNMAGRGVDIKLGDGVEKIGGLHVIGTERHEARRIDNQLRGRCGRQGDQGSSRFFVSLQDDIMRLFGGDAVAKVMDTLKIPENVPIENPMISKAIESAQSRVEGHNFDIRKRLVDYDDVLNKQREIIYSQRRKILEQAIKKDEKDEGEENQNLKDLMLEKIGSEIDQIIAMSQTESKVPNYEQITKEFFTMVPFDEKSQGQIKEQVEKLAFAEKISEFLFDLAKKVYGAREEQYGAETTREIEKLVLLNTIDNLWINHLEDIDYLREGIGLRGYASRDPLVEYKGEAFKLFEELMRTIDFEVTHRIFKIQLVPQQQTQQVTTTTSGGSADTQSLEPIKSTSNKIGRNDPCPCGSGLKYKKCGLVDSPAHQENMAKARA